MTYSLLTISPGHNNGKLFSLSFGVVGGRVGKVRPLRATTPVSDGRKREIYAELATFFIHRLVITSQNDPTALNSTLDAELARVKLNCKSDDDAYNDYCQKIINNTGLYGKFFSGSTHPDSDACKDDCCRDWSSQIPKDDDALSAQLKQQIHIHAELSSSCVACNWVSRYVR